MPEKPTIIHRLDDGINTPDHEGLSIEEINTLKAELQQTQGARDMAVALLEDTQARVQVLEEAITKAIVLKRFHPDRSVVPILEAALAEEPA